MNGVSISLDELIKLRLQAQSLTLTHGRKIYQQRSGNYLSRFRGRGMDFDEVRIYQAGDDIRSMDWRVTARTNKPHTKLYREERERPVLIVVDYSASMFFGTRVAFKSVIAAQAASVLAWAAGKQGDCVGGLVFSGSKHVEVRPASHQHGILPLLKMLAEFKPATQEEQASDSFAKALMRVRHVVRPGSLIILISDFHKLGGTAERHLSQLVQHNEIVSLFIYDRLEKEPPPANHYAISDGQHIVNMDTGNQRFRNAYQQQFTQHHETLQQIMSKRAIPLLEIRTEHDIVQQLQYYFGKHSKQTVADSVA